MLCWNHILRRKKAKTDSEEFFQLINNAVFRKAMKNETRRNYLVLEPN